MPIHELHDTADGGSIRVAIRRPKRDRKIRRGEERPLPHLSNKQKYRQDDDIGFQPSTVQKTEEVQATPVDDSTTQNQTQPFFTQESTMTQATTTQETAQTAQAAQTETQASFQEQLKDLKKEVQQQAKKEEKSSFWKTTAKVAGGVAAVAGIAAGGYFAWKKYGSS